MKAWSVTDVDYSYCEIVFAETRGQAKAIALGTEMFEDTDYVYLKARRRPKLDRYYKGRSVMDWENMDDRVIMVKEDHMYCSDDWDVPEEECEICKAKEWCAQYDKWWEDE